METVRVYAACLFDLQLTRRLAALSASVRRACAEKGWEADFVSPPALHATLAVLGEIDLGLVSPVVDALAETARQRGPFKLQLGGLRAGPDDASPTHLAVGVHQGGELLESLADDLARRLESLGFAPPPPPPRVLIARVRRANGAARELFAAPADLGASTVHELVLYRGDRARPNLEPPVLARFSLTAPPRAPAPAPPS
ncbi:MAG: 2'-5' RNA ligase family protein [Polyangiales bacterium]